MANNDNDLLLLEEIAAGAGKIAMKYFKSKNQVWMKSGNSPVSDADMAVNDYLQQHLMAARPDYGWLSEETEDNSLRMSQTKIFVVDPIDGTRGFIDGRKQWCISIAIVEAGRPVAAVLECPVLGETYCTKTGDRARLNGSVIHTAQSAQINRVTGSRKINEIVAAASKSKIDVSSFVPSLAYRIAMVAAGKIDLAIARPGAHDWDLAAVDLIVTNAGGHLVGADGQRLIYNRKNLRHGALFACPIKLQKSALELAKSTGILH